MMLSVCVRRLIKLKKENKQKTVGKLFQIIKKKQKKKKRKTLLLLSRDESKVDKCKKLY